MRSCTLTHAQRRDVDLLFGPQDNAHVVPHAIRPGSQRPLTATGRRVAASSWRMLVHANASSMPSAPWPRRRASIGRAEHLRPGPSRSACCRDRGARRTGAARGLHVRSRRRVRRLLLHAPHEHPRGISAWCWSSAWRPVACPSPTTSSTDRPTSWPTASTASSCPRATKRRSADASPMSPTPPGAACAGCGRRPARRAEDYLPSAVLPLWGPVLEAAAERARSRRRPPGALARGADRARACGEPLPVTDVRLEATITDVTWDEPGVADLSPGVHLRGAGELTGSPQVDVELVHRPTGRAHSAPARRCRCTRTRPVRGSDDAVRVSIDPCPWRAGRSRPAGTRPAGRDPRGRHGRPAGGSPGWLPLPAAAPRGQCSSPTVATVSVWSRRSHTR